MSELIEESYSLFQRAYDHFNDRLFGGILPRCLITFQRQNRLMGYASFKRWVNDQAEYVDELAINPEYFANFPTVEIFQTLCHEMVHVWQEHFGTPSRRGYHNKEWASKMIEIGLMPSTTGREGGDIVGEKVTDYVLEDGTFLKAANELVEKGFTIKWMDTYPVPNRKVPTTQHLKNKPLLESVATEHVIDNDLPYSMETLNNAIEASMAHAENMDARDRGLTQTLSRVTTSKPRKKSGRNKYYCSECFVQAWAKPGVHLICGDCNTLLTEEE